MSRADRMNEAARAIHAKLVWILVGTYALAGIAPGPGLAIRRLSAGTFAIGRSRFELGAPTLLLVLLLFDASLGSTRANWRKLAGRAHVALVGLFANSAFPLVLTLTLALILTRWHSADEAQSLIVGLAFVAAMPIAGSSTAWSQNAEGNLTLSLALILGSTLLSQLLTPLLSRIVALATTGDYAEDLRELTGASTELFLAVAVEVPAIAGIGLRWRGASRIRAAMPWKRGRITTPG